MAKILLTGGSGFLGSALALFFETAGHEVALPLRPSSSLARLGLRQGTFRIGRCETEAELAAFVRAFQPEIVVHTACSYGRLGETFSQIVDVNLRLGLVLLDALQASPRRVSFINTGTVLPADVSAYALSKRQFSDWGRLSAGSPSRRLQFVNVRLQHMYGPGDDNTKFTASLIRACLRNDAEVLLTPGDQRRDFIYIDDVLSAYMTLVTQLSDLEAAEDVDIGSGQAPTIRDFAETVCRLTDSRTILRFGATPYRAKETMHSQASLTRMAALGWRPGFSLEHGLTKTIAQERELLAKA